MADRVFAQVGVGDSSSAVIGGLNWDWSWHQPMGSGALSGYWEMSLGRWEGHASAGHDSAWITQLGVTPVLRYESGSWPPGWFVEAGIGVNFLAPIYRSGDKRFSTVFNFGDHIGLGKRFGVDQQHELALRIQHFSNGSIKKPNPGENFIQLRYSHSW